MSATLFGKVSERYARYRPSYPPELFAYLASIAPAKKRAWDCATGNGQAALLLSSYFESVEATDLSAEQIAHAFNAPNIRYSVAPAEDSKLPDRSFDLITVAMAAHWFDHARFYSEARRVAATGGILAIFGYSAFDADFPQSIKAALEREIYAHLAAYWKAEVLLLMNGYRDLPFPFVRLETPAFALQHEFTLAEWIGMISSWSAYQAYEERNGPGLLLQAQDRMAAAWSEPRTISMPIHLLVTALA